MKLTTTPNWFQETFSKALGTGQENQFGSTRGLRYGPLRINKTGIFVNNGTLDSTIINNTGFHGYGLTGSEQITLDATTGLNVTDGTSSVLKAEISGTNVGDVTIGAYGSNAGAFYDKSANTFTFKGTLSADIVVASGALTVGTNVGLGTAQDSAGVTTIVGNTVTTGYVNALSITARYLHVDAITALTLNASQITAGTFTVGGTNQPTAITINESSLTGNARLGWQHGSRMWEDSSSRLGINSIGSPMYIYINSSEQIVIPKDGQTTIRDGVYCDGNLNVTGAIRCNAITMDQSADEANIGDVNIIKGYNDLNFQLGNDGYRFSFYNTNFDEKAYINSNGKFHSSSASIQLNGTDKTAIVSTSQGYNALYCAESPEVWFFDFCETKKKIDPMFLEVTEGEMKFIKCDKGYQVWRKRKGHANKRFENKTVLQFYKNESFLKLAK